MTTPMAHSGKQADALQEQERQLTVVKRNGMLVPFRRERIKAALEAAFRDTRKIGKEAALPSDVEESVVEVTNLVVEEAFHLGSKGTCLTVEGIQDLVELTLMKNDYHDVARDYIIYRDHHKELRSDAPENIRITRRDGSFARFNPMKVASSIEASFRRSMRMEGPSEEGVLESVDGLTQSVIGKASSLNKEGKMSRPT